MHTDFYKTYKSQQDNLLRKLTKGKKNIRGKTGDIKYITHENLIKLKYEDHCKFYKDWQYACRGSTFIKSADTIQPFFNLNKFFSCHQFSTYLKCSFDDYLKKMELDGYKFLYMPKFDGTNIQCFVDSTDTLHIYTLGCIGKNNIHNTSQSYYDVVYGILQKSHPDILSYLFKNIGTSVICELLSPFNVIETKYTFDNPAGKVLPIVTIDTHGIPHFFSTYSYDRWPFDASNYELIKNYAFSDMCSKTTIYGDNPEGLVAYAYIESMCFPIAKLKRPDYLHAVQCHLNKNIDPKEICIKKPYLDLQQLLLDSKIDDIDLLAEEKLHIEHFQEYIISTAEQFDKQQFLKSFLSLKEFTKNIESLDSHLKQYKEALFQIRKIGFEYTTAYNFVIQLLNTKLKDITLIKKFQSQYGENWFIVIQTLA